MLLYYVNSEHLKKYDANLCIQTVLKNNIWELQRKLKTQGRLLLHSDAIYNDISELRAVKSLKAGALKSPLV